jgi:DEAD/DEAH box helicase domain-containing protein
MAIEVFFDIETKRIFDDIEGNDPADLGISIISVYVREGQEGKMYSFWEENFTEMWRLFANADRIIGFNSLHFDVPAMAPLAPYDFKKLNHFDIMDPVKNVLGFRVGLGVIAQQTLGHNKIDHGLNAVKYWAEHTHESLQKLKKYCEADVQVTKEVYDFGMKNKYLKYIDKWNTVRTFPVDFSYPVKAEKPQLGLF